MADGSDEVEGKAPLLSGWMIVVIIAIIAAAGVGVTAIVAHGSSTSTVTATTTTKPARAQRPRGPTTTVATTTTTTTATTTTPVATTTTTTNPARQILAPATSPPVVDECSIPLSYGADGDTNPYCSGSSGVNVLAWRYLAVSYPVILGMGASASEQQVLQAMCESSPPYSQVETAAQLAATYYGWGFATAPTFTGWNAGQCG